MGIKKAVTYALALKHVKKGFTGGQARRWVREVYRHKTKDYGFTRRETNWAISHGFMPEQVKKLGITEENYKDYISAYDYAYLSPLNGGYNKWITDKVTIFNIFKPFRDKMPEMYYQITNYLDDMKVIALGNGAQGDSIEDVILFIKAKGIVSLEVSNGYSASEIKYEDGKFYLDGKEKTEEQINKRLIGYRTTLVVCEKLYTSDITEHGILNLIVFNEEGDNPVIGDAYFVFDDFETKKITDVRRVNEDILEEPDIIDDKFSDAESEAVDAINGTFRGKSIAHWDEIKDTIDSFCRFVPQLEFFGVELLITEEGFKIVHLRNNPEYPTCMPFSKATSAYLRRKVDEKKKAFSDPKVRNERGRKKSMLKIRAFFAQMLYPKGLVPYLSIKWIKEVWKDFTTNKETTLGQKLWAYRRGFISYRIPQYGITQDNIGEYISDFEYKWLRHINPKYRKWMEDKITVKYICSDYNYCFPEYYFHIVSKNNVNKVIPMMDIPEGYTNSFDEVFRLVEEKKVLALKPDEGSHGDGFYKFTCENGQYQLNYKNVTRDDVLKILQDTENKYLVTEYIDMCDELKAVYDGAVNTVRMLVFKRDGREPEIKNAYVRFGSKKTGAVDNVGAGGMTAHIDVETGHFHDAKIVMGNDIVDCPVHPDTKVPIDGYLPHWEQVKKQVLDVTRDIRQLEWFGVDLAVTNDGIKFPEINRFPDYPAVEKYAPETREFLLYKLKVKKHFYGYDVKRNRTLIHLPKRN